MPTSPQPGDTTVISTVSLQNGVNLPVARGGDISDAWINTANHTTRDALLSNITTLGTLVRTLNDGIVWEVTSVGPVVYTAWSGSGGVTSFNTRVGAVVPVSGDYAASGVTNDSSVTGTGVKGALNTLLASLGTTNSTVAALVTGVSSVFGRAGAVAAAVGDYLASQITNDSTVAGTRVSDALNTLKALAGSAVPGNTAAASVAAWFVSASTGSDSNNGQSSGTAFATTEKLQNTLCPNGIKCTLQQSTAFTIDSGSYGELLLNLDIPVGSGFAVAINGKVTSGASITLASVVNTVESASAVRGRLTTASGTFVDKARIRSTSGVTAGAITYSMGLTGATDTWVKTWNLPGTGGVVNVANGTTCVIDTLTTTIARFRLTAYGGLIGAIGDLIFPSGLYVDAPTEGSQSFLVNGCQLGDAVTTWRVIGNIQLTNCVYGAAGGTALLVGQPIFRGSMILGPFDVQGGSANSAPSLQSGNAFNGGSIVVGGTATTASDSIGLDSPVEWTNGAGMAIVLNSIGAVLGIKGQQYGFGAPYTVGVSMVGGTHASATTAALVAIPATQPLQLAGNNRPYSAIPISFDRADCSFVLSSDTTALSTEAHKIAATLSDVQSATDVIASPAPGPQYTAKAYLEILVAGIAGKLIVNEIHTGPSGTVLTTPITAPADITTVGNAGQGVVTLAVNGTSAVQYSVTSAPGTFTKGSLSYKLLISITPEPI